MEKNMAPKAFTELELKIQQKVEQDDLLENLKNNLNKLESHYEMKCFVGMSPTMFTDSITKVLRCLV